MVDADATASLKEYVFVGEQDVVTAKDDSLSVETKVESWCVMQSTGMHVFPQIV